MSIRKRQWTSPSGEIKTAWVVDYKDVGGNRRLKTFKTKKAADAFALTAGSEVRDGVHVADRESATVYEAGKLWLKARTRAGLEQSSIDQYRQHLDYHIKPFIGSTRLNALTLPSLRAFEDQLRDEGRSATMVRKVFVSLGSILADAQERGLTNRNVVREMRGRRGSADTRQERRAKGRLRVGVDIPLPSEIKALLGAVQGRWRPLLLTAVFTGLRTSELRGLEWSAVNFDKGTIHVYQRADRYDQIGPPKSEAGERDVPMPDAVAHALRDWQKICPRRDTGRRDATGKPILELAFVFPNGKGKIESRANIVNRGLCPPQVRAGVVEDSGKVDAEGQPIMMAKYRGMHALRHFYASWCINRKEDGGLALPPKVVQERLGHSSITMTMDVYGHLFPRGDDSSELSQAAEALL